MAGADCCGRCLERRIKEENMPRTEIMKLTARGFSFNVRFLKAPECKAEPKSDILAAIGGLKGEVRGMFSQ